MWPFRRKKQRQSTLNPDNQHSILGRVTNLLRANIHAMLDEAEDPETMLNQLVRDFEASIADARKATGETIAGVRLQEAAQADDQAAITQWQDRAELAAQQVKAAEQRGDTRAAQRAKKLASQALSRQVAAERRFNERIEPLRQQNDTIEQLKDGLVAMQDRLEELKQHREELLNRHRLAQTQTTVATSVSQINSHDSTSALSAMEDKVRRTEANAQAQLELAASSSEEQFRSLESSSDALEVNNRLDALLGTTAHDKPAIE